MAPQIVDTLGNQFGKVELPIMTYQFLHDTCYTVLILGLCCIYWRHLSLAYCLVVGLMQWLHVK